MSASSETPKVLVLNGPNLGRLGQRQPELYGKQTYHQLVGSCVAEGEHLNVAVEVRQSNCEGELIGWLHQAADESLPVVLNPGALGHYSYALRDAVAQLSAPFIEVHLTQTPAREPFRHVSVIGDLAAATITGLGVEGYRAAIRALVASMPKRDDTLHLE